MFKRPTKILIFSLSISCFLSACFLLPVSCFARDFVTDWYIKSLDSEIVVNKDSSLLVTERIIADCDNLPDKHGIFRVLPTQIKTTEKIIPTPIKIISITDFSGKPLKYSTINSALSHTVSWKIGDPNIIVTGENDYQITYKVENAVRFDNPQFDEFYWNLNGNFWDMEIDSFRAKIIFPEEVSENDSQVDYYTGFLGEKNKDLASYRWIGDNILQFSSTQTLLKRQGITASITFPKNIFTPYKISFWAQYGGYLWFLLPLIVFIFCLRTWLKYGKDPRIDKTIVPEFGVPDNLTPIEMGALISNGVLKDEYISSAIVDTAVKGIISIEEVKDKVLFFEQKDFKLKKIAPEKIKELGPTEQLLLDKVFGGGSEILLSDLKNEFYKDLPEIKESARDNLIKKDLITKTGLSLQKVFFGASIAISVLLGLIVAMLIKISFSPLPAIISIFASVIILLIFAFVMPRRTQKGAELMWKIQGFKLYMETAEKYRQQFYEKENIFEKFLPYAMVFGITELWIKKMDQLYGPDYFKTYHPAWFMAVGTGAFDANSFTSSMNGISSGIASNIGSASGAGGGGFAGGGGGGGGGGGW